MTKKDCFQLGHVTRTHGTKGEVVVFLDVDYPEDYEDLESVFLEVKGELVPFFIESINVQKESKAIVKFEDIERIEQAQPLINCALFLPDDNLEELDETRFYYHEIIGFVVSDARLGQLGTVSQVYSMPTQDLISMIFEGKEVLIPVNEDIVLTVDRTAKILHVKLPEGLVDVYLEDPNQKPNDADA
jgi:16S rRNA processing protein RimM